MTNKITNISKNKIFGGIQNIISHKSKELGCKMNIAVFVPEKSENIRLPVLYWLSGLTCTEANFIEKAGAQQFASQEKIIIVCPDTSPRGLNIPGDSDAWDFGVGAGFYLNAVQDPWKNNYKMYNYITNELITLINANFPTLEGNQSICGHSMGGHGALICALKNPGLYKSVSTFAAICNPSECPWGQKAFKGYLGARESGLWKDWDATELVKSYKGPPIEIFMDQGTEDFFYKKKQLLPENLIAACKEANVPVILNWREGYDHSYYFIATFIAEHIKYHAKYLKA